ncbi:MAG: tetratricopeptide repeat protein [Candidatus Aminicenantes bacterium]|nr:tetratricopeptide repeat protein [Candidatus Aminicenantes bacterium]
MKQKIKTIQNILVFLILFMMINGTFAGMILAHQKQPEPQAELTIASVDELMKEKSIENCHKAIKGYKLLLKKYPDNLEMLHKIAHAYITIIDIKTYALIEEKDEYKPVLAKYGKIAYEYAEKAYKLNPNCREAVAAALVSYGYYSSSFGIVRAIFKGAAGHYKHLANRLIEIDDKFDGALGYRSLGKLYEVSPWPVGSSRKALKYFKKAVDTDNSLLYSHYYLGLIYFDKGKYDLAKKEFEIVVTNSPHIGEKHFIAPYKERAQRYLTKIARISK